MLIGHEETIDDLKRLAAEKKLAHGYIFFGPAMVGKRMVALAFAKFLETGTFELPAENEILRDVKVIDLAFAKQLNPDVEDSITIDAVREIKNFLWQKPNVSLYRTLIIDDAEIMTSEAQNALLKVAEEPPHSTLLILVTSDIDAIAETIKSRLQKIYFSAVPQKTMTSWAEREFPDVRDLKGLIARSFGKPGLLYAIIRDKKFRDTLESAEKLLKLGSVPPHAGASLAAAKRREFIKKLLDSDDFNLSKFLDAAVTIFSSKSFNADKKNAYFWHKLLKLRRDAANFNPNPRLQLENLFITDNQ